MSIVILMLIVIFSVAIATTNFQTCLQEIQNGTWGMVGGTDNLGHPVSNISTATEITYYLCVHACRTALEPFNWFVFSQQFSLWLLPWLALLSQLLFGANNKLDNFVSVLLTIGSPTLAAYLLALTILNGWWIAQCFAVYDYPNTRSATQILSSLQQSPLKVTTEGSLLTSLVVLPKNDRWWNKLVVELNYMQTWSLSVVASIAWVIIAYAFTLIDSFMGPDPTATIQSTGQGIGSLWLWLLTISLCWLRISPKYDSVQLCQAIDCANKLEHHLASLFWRARFLCNRAFRYHQTTMILCSVTNIALFRYTTIHTSYLGHKPWIMYVMSFMQLQITYTVSVLLIHRLTGRQLRMCLDSIPCIEWAH